MAALLVQQPSAIADFYDEEEIQQRYYPEAEQVVQALTGGDCKLVCVRGQNQI